jgi:hypothetical protein
MRELREALRGLLPHALGGAVGRDEVGVLRLEVAQLALEPVVFLVADLGAVERVVEPLVAAYLLAELVDARRGLGVVRGLVASANSRAPG